MLSSKAAGESKPEAYPLGYVEDFDELRTPLADFFSILVSHGGGERQERYSLFTGIYITFPCRLTNNSARSEGFIGSASR
jgi:hypothetical protein